jgi:hypothetical protein
LFPVNPKKNCFVKEKRAKKKARSRRLRAETPKGNGIKERLAGGICVYAVVFWLAGRGRQFRVLFCSCFTKQQRPYALIMIWHLSVGRSILRKAAVS